MNHRMVAKGRPPARWTANTVRLESVKIGALSSGSMRAKYNDDRGGCSIDMWSNPKSFGFRVPARKKEKISKVFKQTQYFSREKP